MIEGYWDYLAVGVHDSYSDEHKECLIEMDDECNRYHRSSNLLFGCLSTANGLRNAFVLVQISRFQQVIGLYTLQAHTEQAKVGVPARQDHEWLYKLPN